jgi:hypothetical protein
VGWSAGMRSGSLTNWPDGGASWSRVATYTGAVVRSEPIPVFPVPPRTVSAWLSTFARLAFRVLWLIVVCFGCVMIWLRLLLGVGMGMSINKVALVLGLAGDYCLQYCGEVGRIARS